jgi:hypothetical protein
MTPLVSRNTSLTQRGSDSVRGLELTATTDRAFGLCWREKKERKNRSAGSDREALRVRGRVAKVELEASLVELGEQLVLEGVQKGGGAQGGDEMLALGGRALQHGVKREDGEIRRTREEEETGRSYPREGSGKENNPRNYRGPRSKWV